MDASSVKNLVEQLIPFAKKTGVVAEELTATKVKLRLPDDPTNLNPMGILHAGATFTLAETAAAALCLMALGSQAMFIGKRVDISFRRPGKGEIAAVAQLTPVEAQRILDGVKRDGKTEAAITVDVVDGAGEPVASATVTMSVRRIG
ncbi:MAG: thioesterase [Myxococcales bacterium]|nr:thioesterase [Myxococcales bacterium]